MPAVDVHHVAREEFAQTPRDRLLAGLHEQVGVIREERTGLDRAGPLLRPRDEGGEEVRAAGTDAPHHRVGRLTRAIPRRRPAIPQ